MKSVSLGILVFAALATSIFTSNAGAYPIKGDYVAAAESWQQSNASLAKRMMDADYEAWQRSEKRRAAGCVLSSAETKAAFQGFRESQEARFGIDGLMVFFDSILRKKTECAGFF
ncbi:hypothetical protein [Burkholderia alba]|uniref:hypothetical protein n=1 Tax=Burkholderia alba TaxID=2683677 RepID=UPI002B05FEAB|nr:hypothetical protein [Burkholderia alba]